MLADEDIFHSLAIRAGLHSTERTTVTKSSRNSSFRSSPKKSWKEVDYRQWVQQLYKQNPT